MVAAALGIGSAVGGIGSALIGSSSAGDAANVQRQALAQQRQIFEAALPMSTGLQQTGYDTVSGLRNLADEGIRSYGNAGINALYGGAQNAYDALTGYAPVAAQYVQGGADRGINMLSPWITAGGNAAQQAWNEIAGGQLGAMPSLTDYSQLPGYQFTLTQGEQAARNAASAAGYGGIGAEGSGPLGKSLINFAEGTANTFGNQYLQNYWANQNNRYNILAGLAGLGGQAAATGAGIANQAGTNVGNIYSRLGDLVGNLESTLGANAANTFAGIGSNLANVDTAASGQLLTALNDPFRSLMGLAGTTSTNLGTSANALAGTVQNQGNILGAGLSGGINSGISNYLLKSAIDNPSGGSTLGGTGGLY